MSIYTRLRTVAEANPEKPAVIADDTSLTYAQLIDGIERCARGMTELDCGSGDAIAVALPSGLDFIHTVFAAFAQNCILVPLNPGFREAELRRYLDSVKPRLVFLSPELECSTEFAGSAAVVRCADLARAVESAGVTRRPVDGDSPAIQMFTSGSTGESKRVTRTQNQLLMEFDALSASIALSPRDRILAAVPLFHAYGFGNALMAALLSGGQLYLSTTEFNPRKVASALAELQITMFPGVPFMFKMLSETRFSRPPSFASLRLTMSAGAPLPEAVAQRFQERFSIPISQQYGCTEVGTIAVNTQSPVAKPTSVGLPIPGCQLEVRDESGRVVPAGELGEVWVKSRTMATCYDSAADATSKSFRDGFFCAGDQGYVDDQGLLFVTGRKNLVINVGGFKVDPSEVEQVLRKHPSVQDVVVLGVTHPQYGEQLKAAVVPNPQALCSADDLRAFAEGQLVDYKVPTLIEFIREIPTSPVGKILRKYLAESH